MKDILSLDQHRVVTLIGAGGKTTTMYLLAREMADIGKKVLVTTTTKIFYSIQDEERFVEGHSLEEWLERLESRMQPGDFLVSGVGVKDGKIQGVEPEWVDELARRGLFDLILVEGDGSARKPLKAPSPFEPVIPKSTTLLLVLMGLRIVGKQLDSDIVHRLERFTALTGREAGQKIRVEDYFKVFTHPNGYNLLEMQKKYTVIPVINQVDAPKQENIALKLANMFRKVGIEMVLLTSYRYEKIIRKVCR